MTLTFSKFALQTAARDKALPVLEVKLTHVSQKASCCPNSPGWPLKPLLLASAAGVLSLARASPLFVLCFCSSSEMAEDGRPGMLDPARFPSGFPSQYCSCPIVQTICSTSLPASISSYLTLTSPPSLASSPAHGCMSFVPSERLPVLSPTLPLSLAHHASFLMLSSQSLHPFLLPPVMLYKSPLSDTFSISPPY